MAETWRKSKLRNEPQEPLELPRRAPVRTVEVWQRPKPKGPAQRRSLRTRRANRRKNLQERGYL